MADNNESVSFKVDLDAKDATASVLNLKNTLSDLASTDIEGLIEGFTTLAGPIIIAGTAIFALKKAFDFAIEGESLLALQQNFNTITSAAGLSGQAILDGMTKAAQGTISEKDALDLAATSVNQLGAGAAKIPQIMTLARQISVATGQSIQSVFENLSNAITTGNARLIKRMGIVVDVSNSELQYAQSVGKLNNELTAQDKINARLNAVLIAGENKYSKINTDITPLIDSTKRLSAAWDDLGDGVKKFFANNFAAGFAQMTEGAASFIKTLSGDGGQQVKNLENEINTLRQQWTSFYQIVNQPASDKNWLDHTFDFLAGGAKDRVAQAQKDMDSTSAKIDQLEAKLKELNGGDKKADSTTADGGKDATKQTNWDAATQAKRLANKAKFEQEMLTLRQSREQAEMAIETDVGKYQDDVKNKQVELAATYEAKIEKLKAEAAKNDTINQKQATQMIEQLEAEKDARIKQLQLQAEDDALKVYDNQLVAAKDFYQGYEAASGQATAQARRDLDNYGKQGKVAFTAIQSGAATFFESLGSGSKSAGDLMKGFMFTAIADIAQEYGEMLLAAGIGSFDPVQIAEGGALLALSGLLRSEAGGAGSSSSSSSGGGGSSGGGTIGSVGGGLTQPTATATAQKSVNINISGHYFETQETKQRLVDMIRQESDATDFNINQVPIR